MMAACHLELKDALYRAVSPCRIDFLEALMHFGHPNIVSAEVVPFCRCIENSYARPATTTRANLRRSFHGNAASNDEGRYESR